MNDFAAFNKLYEGFFGQHKPARSCVEVARLPKDVLVEMECVRGRCDLAIEAHELTVVSNAGSLRLRSRCV